MVSAVTIEKEKGHKDPLEDAGIVSDVKDLWEQGDFVDRIGNTIGVAADASDLIANPVKTVVSNVVSWIIAHVDPLPFMLQQFTGDPEKAEAAALTWEHIGQQWTDAACELKNAVASGLDGQVCRTLNAYKVQMSSVVETFQAMGDACRVVAKCLNVLSAILKIVYDLTREAIGDLVGTFAQSVGEALGTAGIAIPIIVGQIATTVAKWVTRITAKAKQVLHGFKEALKAFKSLETILEKFGSALKKLFSRMSNAADKVQDAWKAGKDKAGDVVDDVHDAFKSGARKVGDFVDDPKGALKAGTDKIGDLAEGAWKAGKDKADDLADGAKDAWATGKRGVGEFVDDPRGAMKAGGEKAQEFYRSTVRKPIDYMGKPSEYGEEVGKKWGEKATRFMYRGQSAERLEKLDEFFARGDRSIHFEKARGALSDVNDFADLIDHGNEIKDHYQLPSQNKDD